MSRILILFAHPVLEKSRVQSRLVAHTQHLEGVTFHDLYEAYPDFDIDVKKEQQLLLEHDIIIWQHPFTGIPVRPLSNNGSIWCWNTDGPMGRREKC
jgi:glutathione-regulated potassium-efflux system ancillary protein KefG